MTAHACTTHNPNCFRCDLSREELSPETREALERGLAQSAAGDVVDLGSFSTPVRVTLTDEERLDLAEEISGWMPTAEGRANPQAWALWVADRVIKRDTTREQALRAQIKADLLAFAGEHTSADMIIALGDAAQIAGGDAQ